MRGLRRLKKKNMAAALLTMCLVTVLAGCGASAKYASTMESAPQEYYMNSSDAKYEETVEMESVAMDSVAMDSGVGSASGAAAMEVGEANAADMVATDRKLIKTVNMDVETQEFDVLLSTIEGRVAELGGYIENMNTYNGSSYYTYRNTRNADMTIRIPKDNLNTFLSAITDISNVVRRSDNVEDVTLTYVDLESHRDALRTEQTRLLELLEKAETIEDIITIEQRLSDVRYQLESMESRLRTYDNQVDYSTVYLNIEEVEVLTPVEEETTGERISRGFSSSWESIGTGLTEFGIWFVINLPYMIVCLGSVAVFVLIILGVIKMCGKKSAKKSNEQSDRTKNTQENTQEVNK